LENLLASFDRSDQTVAAGGAAAIGAAKLSVTDIIAVTEKLQAGASVLDVSFEPQDGKPLNHGGLALSRYTASAALAALIVVLITLLPQCAESEPA
jgi:hypothetical protein